MMIASTKDSMDKMVGNASDDQHATGARVLISGDHCMNIRADVVETITEQERTEIIIVDVNAVNSAAKNINLRKVKISEVTVSVIFEGGINHRFVGKH